MIKKVLKIDLIISTVLINIFSLALPIYVIQALTRYLSHGISETLYVLTVGTLFAVILELFLRNYRITALELDQKKDNSKTSNYFQKLSEINFEDKNLKLVQDLPQKLKKYRIQSSNNEISTLTSLLDSPFIIVHLAIIYLLSKTVFLLFILFVIISYALKALSSKAQSLEKSAFSNGRDKNNYFEKEFINNFQTLSLYADIKKYLKQFENQEKKINKTQKTYFSLLQKFDFNTSFIRSLLSMFVIFIACISIYEGEMEIGVLIALNIIIAKTFSPIISFYDLIKKINASQLDKDFDSLSKIYPIRDGKLTLKKSLGKIELRKVSLQYPEHQISVFEDFSLIFEPGSVTVITGKNGVGKSTLYRIITGIQKPDKGEILIDNINIEQIKQDIFKKQFISVPQEPSFFEGTIKENFSAVNEELSNDNIISAISNSNLGEFLGETEKGIDTFIDSKGSKFSLGIKKRLALARASLTNGSIVIFDEPTEGLDQEGANLYYKYLNEAMKLKKTIIILSHDKEIIKGADNIINLNNFSKPTIFSRSKLKNKTNE